MTAINTARLAVAAFALLYIVFVGLFPFIAVRNGGRAARHVAMVVIAIVMLGIPLLQIVTYRALAQAAGRIHDVWVTAFLIVEALMGLVILFWRLKKPE